MRTEPSQPWHVQQVQDHHACRFHRLIFILDSKTRGVTLTKQSWKWRRTDEACADATVRGDELLDDARHGGLHVHGAVGVARVETFQLKSGMSDEKRMDGYQEQQRHVGAAWHAGLGVLV
jgi:hypothetical protein